MAGRPVEYPVEEDCAGPSIRAQTLGERSRLHFAEIVQLAFDLRPQKGVVVQAGIEDVMKERDRLIPELKGLLNLN